MKSIISLFTVLAMGTLFASAADEKPASDAKPEATPATPAAPAETAKRKHDPAKAFKKLDTNGDGFLSLEEFKASPHGQKDPAKAEEMFKKKDKDGDGKLSLEEFAAHGGKKKNK
jgi:hypothetical protein